jgi:hypothetical protein
MSDEEYRLKLCRMMVLQEEIERFGIMAALKHGEEIKTLNTDLLREAVRRLEGGK